MKTEVIKIPLEHKDLYIDEILFINGHSKLLPSNAIINKVRPNFGATHCEITAERHSIIIVPFVDVEKVKKAEFKSRICIVYEDTDNDEITEYLKDGRLTFKKFLTTPESFLRLISQIKIYDKDYRNNYFLLYDECEQLIANALFRNGLLAPLSEFFLFKNKSMISATPLIPTDQRFEESGFRIIEFRPDFDYKIDLKLITTNNIRSSLRNQISIFDDGKPIFIFTNCTDTILYASRLIDDFKIFCAEDLDNRYFKLQGTPNVHHSVKNQEYAAINCFTSRFFSAVDMYVNDVKPHVIMVTNIPTINHSIIDPSTEAIQIYGRLRRGVSSITHISKVFQNRTHLTEDKIVEELEFGLKVISRLNDVSLDFNNDTVRSVVDAICDHNLCRIIADEADLKSYYIDCYLHKLIKENKYISPETLITAYNNTEFFRATLRDVKHPVSDEDQLKVKRSKGKQKRIEVAYLIYNLLKHYQFNKQYYDEEFFEQLNALRSEDQLTYELFINYGIDLLIELGFNLKKMKERYFSMIIDKRDHDYSVMIDNILTTFIPKIERKSFSSDIKNILQSIYNKYSYHKDYSNIHIAKATDILKYFDAKFIEPKKPHKTRRYETYYILTAPKYQISKDLELL